MEGWNYESPIEKTISDIQNQLIEQEENYLMMEVKKTIGFNIDKIELLKALEYDRNQYEKGFQDAKKQYERPTGKWKRGLGSKYHFCTQCNNCALLNDKSEEIFSNFCPNCGAEIREVEE